MKEEGRYEMTNLSDLSFELLVGDTFYRIDPNSTIRFTMKIPQPMRLKNCITEHREMVEIE